MDNALILVAEDEPEIARILTSYLERDGFRTVTAGDGEAALMHHLMLKPDLVCLMSKCQSGMVFQCWPNFASAGQRLLS